MLYVLFRFTVRFRGKVWDGVSVRVRSSVIVRVRVRQRKFRVRVWLG